MLEGKGGEPVPSNKFFLHLYIVKIQNMIYTYIKNSSSSGRKTMEKKKFKDLTIRDAFLFAAVMTDREICRKLLELSTFYSVVISESGQLIKVDTADISSLDEEGLSELAFEIAESGESDGVRNNLIYRMEEIIRWLRFWITRLCWRMWKR